MGKTDTCHGGNDPGASGNGIIEKDINLDKFDILNYFSEINVTWVDVTHLITILDERDKFVNSVKLYETSDESNKYQIKEI